METAPIKDTDRIIGVLNCIKLNLSMIMIESAKDAMISPGRITIENLSEMIFTL